MKKLFGILGLALLGLSLASCSGENLDDFRTNDTLSDTIKNELKLNFDNKSNSIRLSDVKGSATDFYDVYIPSNYKENIVVVSTKIDDALMKNVNENLTLDEAVKSRRFKSMAISPLLFYHVGLYTTEQTQLLKEVNNTTYGITSIKDGNKNYDFGFDLNVPTTWTSALKADALLSAYNDGKTTGLTFDVAYLPVLFERYAKSSACLRTYILVPIYEAYCYNGSRIVEADNEVGYEIKANPIANFDKVTLTYKEDEAGAKWLANSK